MNKIILIILGIFILGFALFVIRGNEDTWICTENGWVEHGKPNVTKPMAPCGKIEKEQLVEKYLRENISVMSAQKEVSGGKFYITKIDWVGDNSGIAEYEDGHIALKASFNYEIKANEQKSDYSVVISNFKIIE